MIGHEWYSLKFTLQLVVDYIFRNLVGKYHTGYHFFEEQISYSWIM